MPVVNPGDPQTVDYYRLKAGRLRDIAGLFIYTDSKEPDQDGQFHAVRKADLVDMPVWCQAQRSMTTAERHEPYLFASKNNKTYKWVSYVFARIETGKACDCEQRLLC